MEKLFCVYILTNVANTVLYIGMTGNLPRRLFEHKEGLVPGFTKKYRCTKLVYVEPIESDAYSAATREKQLKGWSRQKKIDLITSQNPTWKDLTDTYDL